MRRLMLFLVAALSLFAPLANAELETYIPDTSGRVVTQDLVSVSALKTRLLLAPDSVNNYPRGEVLPVYRSSEVYVTSAQILALNTTPIQVLAAEPGYFHILQKAHLFREAGTAYVANGATSIVVRLVDGSGAIGCHSFDLALITATIDTTYILSCPSFNGTGFNGSDPSTRNVNQAYMLHAVGGNPTTGTGGIYVTLWYYKFKHGRLP